MTRRLIMAWIVGSLVAVGAVAPAAQANAEKRQLNLAAGIRALEAEDFESAVRQLERAIVADPKSSLAYYHLGRSHRGLGDSVRALKYFRLALLIEPNNFPALHERGETLLAAGKADEAREVLSELEERCGGSCPETSSLRRAILARE